MNDFAAVTGELVKYNIYNLKQLVFEVTDMCNLNCKYGDAMHRVSTLNRVIPTKV
jgi:molybdenum cofactor biosynthesis enzyme MoaA